MNILWITGTIFPAPSKKLGKAIPVFGGWMYNLAENLSRSNNLAIATSYNGNDFKKYIIDKVVYYLLPSKHPIRYDQKLEKDWKKVVQDFNPDIVHIHGTEYAPGLACMRSNPALKYVVSIQGLIGIIARNYYGGLTYEEIFRNITFRDIIKNDTIFHAKHKFKKRGILEKEYVTRTEHVIGRTDWDFAHTKVMNPKCNYHFCNESLRKSFYTSRKWDIDDKTDHSIFISQAGYPFKGLHNVLKAVYLLKSEFPLVKVRIGGYNIMSNTTLKDKLRLSGYGAYLRDLVNKLDILNEVQFTGILSEDQMINELKKAHVFICSSSIENSSNSLGEAQLIGVPVIASYVGGNPNMIIHAETGFLYRFEEIEMLAEVIRKIFTNNSLAKKISENGIMAAQKRHDLFINLNKLLLIYDTIYHSRDV